MTLVGDSVLFKCIEWRSYRFLMMDLGNLLLKEPNVFINCPSTYFNIDWHFIFKRICRKNSTAEYLGIHLGLWLTSREVQNISKELNFNNTRLLISIWRTNNVCKGSLQLMHIFLEFWPSLRCQIVWPWCRRPWMYL